MLEHTTATMPIYRLRQLYWNRGQLSLDSSVVACTKTVAAVKKNLYIPPLVIWYHVDNWTGDWTGVVLKGVDRARAITDASLEGTPKQGGFRYYEVPVEFVTKCTLDEARAWLSECEEVWQ